MPHCAHLAGAIPARESTGSRRSPLPSKEVTYEYIVISADTHAGAALEQYKAYLPRERHDEFDLWVQNFADGWSTVDEPAELRMGVSPYLSPVNWDSSRRLRDLEAEGIAAEVIYPNTVPPFFPAGVITSPGPRNTDEYEMRWEDLKALNRWLVDFCSLSPGRRIGLEQVFLFEIRGCYSRGPGGQESRT